MVGQFGEEKRGHFMRNIQKGKQAQTTEHQIRTKSNQKGKAGLAAKNADMTKNHDGSINEHSVKADKQCHIQTVSKL